MNESQDTPEKLYKYLPGEYVKQVLKGSLLFRNLTYFRQHEDKVRGDETEGIHIDHPDNPITIEVLNRLVPPVIGDFSFLNSIEQDKIFVFCLSTVLERKLFDEFRADCCIVTEDVPKFLLRCRSGIIRYGVLNKCGFLHRRVDYYRSNEAAQRSVKDPQNLPFFKDARFKQQYEYRLVCGMKGAFTLKQRIVDNKIFSFQEEIQKGRPYQRTVRVGNLEDIARVVHKREVIGGQTNLVAKA